MLKNNILAAAVLLVVLVLNLWANLSITKKYQGFLEHALVSQVDLWGEPMENALTHFDSEVNEELSYIRVKLDNLDQPGVSDGEKLLNNCEEGIHSLMRSYSDLVTRVEVINDQNAKRAYQWPDDGSGNISSINIPLRRQPHLYPRHKVERTGSVIRYYYPYFGETRVIGNVIVDADLSRYAHKVLHRYNKVLKVDWHWLLDENGEILYDDFGADSVFLEGLSAMADSIQQEIGGLVGHEIRMGKEKPEKVYTACYPMSIGQLKMGVMFTLRKGPVYSRYFRSGLIILILTQVLFTLLVIYFLINIYKNRSDSRKLKYTNTLLRQLIEQFPIGMLVLDDKQVIRNINSAGQRMLFLNNDGSDLVGQEFNKQFLVSNKYLLNEQSTPFMDDSQYLYYEKEGMETVIYRNEKNIRAGGESFKLISLIDVSPIERSRKSEMAANRAKSDFLAAMSHEIRTPMNGILGMVNTLLEEKTSQQVNSKIEIVRRSAELLMNIINDILDFSKIEAGRMMLEEIPFNLDDELELVKDLFEPLAREKGLELVIEQHPSVPNKLIGDPFRLRQVISNLVSNAVKFTDQGKIVIRVILTEVYKGQLNLLFTVEDTGVGIPTDRLKDIFGSYTQARGSVQRKFGGTGLGTAIAKQLVELMHGDIWVDSPSGISKNEDFPGSRFSFTIEAYSNERIPKSFDYANILQLTDTKALILTKDSAPEKYPITQVLKSFGVNVDFKIYQDSNQETVLNHLDRHHDYHLLILVDKNQLDGFALAREMKDRKLSQYFPMLLISSNDKQGNYISSKKLSIDRYLIEPFEASEVASVIREFFPNIVDQSKLDAAGSSLPSNLSILLAEDNLINQKVAQSIFKNIGYEIDIAVNGKEALEKLATTEYDIVFMDLLMPEMDGFEACEALRKKHKKLPVIALSADDNEETLNRAFEAGMNDYVMKPAKVETIKRVMLKHLGKQK